MAIRVNAAAPTWRLRSWRGPLGGLWRAAVGVVVLLTVTGGILQIDGAGSAPHASAAQVAVDWVAAVWFVAICVLWLARFAGPSRATLVAGTDEGVALVGRRTLVVPWAMVAGVRLGAPDRRSGRRRLPVLELRNGSRLAVARAASRFPGGDLTRIDAAGLALTTAGLHRCTAVRVVEALRARMPAGVLDQGASTAVPAPARPAGPALVDELPGPTVFRRRARDVVPPQVRTAGYGAVMLGVGRIGSAVARSQEQAGMPFNWARFFVVMVLVLAGLEALVLTLRFFSPAETAVGDRWIAQRRTFHRRWAVLDVDDVVSVARRAAARPVRRSAFVAPGPGVVLASASGRRMVLSSYMLEAGARPLLSTWFERSPAAFASALSVLQHDATPETPRPAPDPVQVARRSLRLEVVLLVSYVLFGGIAVSAAVVHHAAWVMAPALVALGAMVWGTVRHHRELDRLRTATGTAGVEDAPDQLTAGLLRVGQGAFVVTVAAAVFALHQSLGAAPPGYATASLTHRIVALPASLSADVLNANGTLDTVAADGLVQDVWSAREQALTTLDPDQLARVDAPHSEALAADLGMVRLATVGQATGNRVPAVPDLREDVTLGALSYPRSLLGEVVTSPPGAARQAVTVVVLTQAAAGAQWQVAFTTDYTIDPGANPFFVGQTPVPAGDAGAAGGIPGQLASYWQGWLLHHRAPPSSFDPGPWTTTLGAQIAENTQGGVVNGGLNSVRIEYHPGYGPWVFPGIDGLPLVCTGIVASETNRSTGPAPMRQDAYRANWGGLLAPGYYHVIIDVSVHPSCVMEEPGGHLLVIGGDRMDLTTTGSR